MQRRRLLATTGSVVLLAACQPGASTQTQIQTDAALVTAGTAAVAVSIEATPNLDPAVKAQIDRAMATVNAANAVIQGATTSQGTAAQQFAAAIRLAAPILLATLSPASNEAIAINAGLALLPTILAASGVSAAPTSRLALGAVQARLILRGYTRK